MKNVPPHRRIAAFNHQRLLHAIQIREQSYRLLLWISESISKGFIFPAQAARHSGGPDAAYQWLRSCYDYIPPTLRPAPESIREFAAFFSTYITTSFDVDEIARPRGEPIYPGGTCRCELCMRIIHAPRLRARKLYSRDKQRAEELMAECVLELAREQGVVLSEQQTASLVGGAETRRFAAYVTYGQWLIRRLSGESDGSSLLVLWRIIAWDPRGGLRPQFSLEIEDLEQAEIRLIAAIQQMGVDVHRQE